MLQIILILQGILQFPQLIGNFWWWALDEFHIVSLVNKNPMNKQESNGQIAFLDTEIPRMDNSSLDIYWKQGLSQQRPICPSFRQAVLKISLNGRAALQASKKIQVMFN